MWSSRSLGALALLVALAATAQAQNQAPDDPATVARAHKIHAKALKIDTHVDFSPTQMVGAPPNYATGIPRNKVDLPKMEKDGLDAVFFSIYVGQRADFSDSAYARALATNITMFEAVHTMADQLAPARIDIAYTAADVRRIHKSGKKVALMGVENGYGIGQDITNVRKFYDRGARYLSLAHNGHSQLSDSNTGEADGVWKWNGLSPLGRQVVEEANRYGIMMDISHPSKASNLQVMAMSKAPVIASHSGVRALCNHSRNLDDEQLLALKKNGGVVQLVAFNSYVKTPTPGSPARATVSDFVDHIDYVVKLIGIEHAGISSDFDGGGGIDGYNDASESFNVTMELVRRGYSEKNIVDLWGGNLLRVMEQVEKVAKQIQAGK